MAAKREKIHFASVEELLGAPTTTGEGTVEIKVDQIFPFENHPFKVRDDDKMDDLVESIKNNGVLTPVLVRPDDEGNYEMISGHRRLHAAKRAGLIVIPAIIKPMTNDEATIAMVDANCQREEILPSERAYSLKMKMDAMRRQGYRSDLNGDTSNHHDRRKETAAIVGEEAGMAQAQVRRYIRLTELLPELLSYVDIKRIGFMTAVTISYFDKQVQRWIYEYIKETGFVRPEQIDALKACENLENMTQHTVVMTMNEAIKPKTSGKVSLSERKLNKYFGTHVSGSERERIIIGLLEEWVKKKEDDK